MLASKEEEEGAFVLASLCLLFLLEYCVVSASTSHSNPRMLTSSNGMMDSRKERWVTRRERLRMSLVKRHVCFKLSSFSRCANDTYAWPQRRGCRPISKSALLAIGGDLIIQRGLIVTQNRGMKNTYSTARETTNP